MELEIFLQKWLSLYYDLEIDTKWFMKAYKVIFNVDFESAIRRPRLRPQWLKIRNLEGMFKIGEKIKLACTSHGMNTIVFVLFRYPLLKLDYGYVSNKLFRLEILLTTASFSITIWKIWCSILDAALTHP